MWLGVEDTPAIADLEVRPGDLTDVRVVALLEHHAATAREQAAAGSAHALDLHAFTSPDLSLWTIWNDDARWSAAKVRARAWPPLGGGQ